MRPARARLTGEVAARLQDGARLAVVGERGSGRTTFSRSLVPDALRGTGLVLVDRPGLALAGATRGEAPGGAALVLDDVQWADADSVEQLAAHPGPVLVTCRDLAELPPRLAGCAHVELAPLDDDEARELVPDADEARLRWAGGNLRLLHAGGTALAGPARRTAAALLVDLDEQEREVVLLLGVAAGAAPLPPSDALARLRARRLVEDAAGGSRLRAQAVGALAVELADDERRAGAHRALAALLHDGAAARHWHAAGDPAPAREAALRAVRAGDLHRDAVADLLLLAGAAEPLPEDLSDLLAGALWDCWRLDELVALAPAGPVQHRVAALAAVARGLPADGPEGVRARAAVAAGTEPREPGPDLDGALAAATASLAAGRPADVPDASGGDPEQRWQAGSLSVVAALLSGEDPAPRLAALRTATAGAPTSRWSACADVLAGTGELLRHGPTADGVEALGSALELVPPPVPAWGVVALAVGQAQLGNAGDATAALERAAGAATSALDRQLVALATAECELATGRPRRAARALDVEVWPVLEPWRVLLLGWARRTVGEQVDPTGSPGAGPAGAACAEEHAALRDDDPARFRAAAAQWEALCRVRALTCRWAAADADGRRGTWDVAALRELEAVAAAQGLLPLLARVRDALRRAGARPARESAPRSGPGPASLSPREVEVLVLVREGLTTPQVATRLGVAVSTVETQVASAMRKLGARSRHHAVALLGAAS